MALPPDRDGLDAPILLEGGVHINDRSRITLKPRSGSMVMRGPKSLRHLAGQPVDAIDDHRIRAADTIAQERRKASVSSWCSQSPASASNPGRSVDSISTVDSCQRGRSVHLRVEAPDSYLVAHPPVSFLSWGGEGGHRDGVYKPQLDPFSVRNSVWSSATRYHSVPEIPLIVVTPPALLERTRSSPGPPPMQQIRPAPRDLRGAMVKLLALVTRARGPKR